MFFDPGVAAQHEGRIDAIMNKDGTTSVFKDGVEIKRVPTHPSQVRQAKSYLWQVGDSDETENT